MTDLNVDNKMDVHSLTEAQQALNNFWPKATDEIKALSQVSNNLYDVHIILYINPLLQNVAIIL